MANNGNGKKSVGNDNESEKIEVGRGRFSAIFAALNSPLAWSARLLIILGGVVWLMLKHEEKLAPRTPPVEPYAFQVWSGYLNAFFFVVAVTMASIVVSKAWPEWLKYRLARRQAEEVELEEAKAEPKRAGKEADKKAEVTHEAINAKLGILEDGLLRLGAKISKSGSAEESCRRLDKALEQMSLVE